jgi:DNA repair photolyase
MSAVASRHSDNLQRVTVARELGVRFADRLAPVETRRGRGAPSNETGRFEIQRRETCDDGWGEDETLEPLRTEITMERPRTIITRNESPDLSFDRSINPYRGCEHGCAYCYARPTHAYLDLSPGLDFETQLYAKPDAARLLESELSAPNYRVKWIQLGASTDPYQPIEKRYEITRSLVEVLSKFNHPFGITTKNVMVIRDIDLLAPMGERKQVMVAISITTLDRKLARAMEPRAATPEKRIQAIRELSAAGIPVIVGVSPMIPGLTDHEMDAILERAAQAGATSAYYSSLRLPLEVSGLFQQWLAAERPNTSAKVMSLVRQMHGGKDYDAQFGTRMHGTGPVADVMRQRFELARKRFGLDRKIGSLNADLFKPPQRPGDQLVLL